MRSAWWGQKSATIRNCQFVNLNLLDCVTTNVSSYLHSLQLHISHNILLDFLLMYNQSLWYNSNSLLVIKNIEHAKQSSGSKLCPTIQILLLPASNTCFTDDACNNSLWIIRCWILVETFLESTTIWNIYFKQIDEHWVFSIVVHLLLSKHLLCCEYNILTC